MVAVLHMALLGSLAHAGEWVERYDKDGVTVSTREVEGSPFKEFLGRAVVPRPLPQVLDQVLDVAAYPAWFPNTPTSKLLERGENTVLYYVVTSFPWPVTDRDTVYEYTVTKGEREATIAVRVRPEAYPAQDGLVRVQSSPGAWTFRTVDGGTEVTWRLHFDPAGRLPGWLANSAIVDVPRDMLINLRNATQG